MLYLFEVCVQDGFSELRDLFLCLFFPRAELLCLRSRAAYQLRASSTVRGNLRLAKVYFHSKLIQWQELPVEPFVSETHNRFLVQLRTDGEETPSPGNPRVRGVLSQTTVECCQELCHGVRPHGRYGFP